jgi:hypothetical protein
MISTIENLGAAYLAFKVADLVFTYFVIRFIWRRGGLIRTRPKQTRGQMNIVYKLGLAVLMGAGFAFASAQALAALHG